MKKPEEFVKISCKNEVEKEISESQMLANQSPSNFIFKAKCLSQPPLFQVVEPNQTLTLKWRFCNSGEQAWPENTTFGMVNGWKDLDIKTAKVEGRVQPNEETEVQISMVAPQNKG